MASAPLLDQTPFYRQPTKLAVRIAYSAPTATEKVAAVVDKLPTEVRAMTLDELTIAGKADGLIRTARQLLSPAAYSAFLRWGELGSYLATKCDTDEEVDRRSDLHLDATLVLGKLPCENIHDFALSTFVLMLEVGYCGALGPLTARPLHDEKIDQVTMNRIAGLSLQSPLIGALNDLSQTAYLLSCSRSSFSESIGGAITAAFSCARGALSAGEDALLLSAFAGCQREMIDWKVNPEQSRQDEEASIERVDGYEMTLLNSRARTIDGVIAKLRVAFQHLIQEGRWTDLSIVDPADPEFVRELDMSDMYARLLWGAISDLSAIGGIDMGAQPAPADPHRQWLTDRNALLIVMNTRNELEDREAEQALTARQCDELNRYEASILKTAPTSADGLLAQMTLISQLPLEGHEVQPAEVLPIVRSAGSLANLGSIDGLAFKELLT